VTGAANILEKLGAAPSVFEQHHELRTLLKQMDKRLIVVVDDVDRLRSNEILDIVRLVRLVGDFPNTLYLLAFDRGRVEECLSEGNLERGRAYLEKIVQVTHDVPIPRQPDVTALFVAGIQQIPDDIPTGPMDEGDLQNIFTFVVRPLLVTPRHVQRLLGSLPMTMRLVGEEVAFADLVGIEAVRVLHPRAIRR
jgi:predicted KAP-like P-loop ATPase